MQWWLFLSPSLQGCTVEPDTWYNKQSIISINKTKTVWNNIKTETKRKGKTEDIFCFSSGNDETYDYLDISDSFNNLYLSIADTITLNIENSNNHNKHKDINSLYYLPQLFNDTLPDIKFRNTSTQEIEKLLIP